jgi:hypothetical protein
MPVMRKKKIWLVLVAVTAAALFLFFGSLWSLPSPEEARELATGTFERYAQQEKIDLRLFEGPRAREVGGAAYAFEWTYSDQEGKLTVLIPVDRGGWTKISFDVDDAYDGSQAAMDKLDRLMQRVKERSRGTG